MQSQSIEIIGGLNKNVFFDRGGGARFNSSYTSELGFVGRIGLDIKLDWLQTRFTLSFDKYSGKLTAHDGGQAGSYTTTADIDKSIISFGFFPINFKIIKRIDLNFGIEQSILIHERFNGTNSGYMIGGSTWDYNLEDRFDKYSSKGYFGLRGRLAYDFNLTDNLILSPQYSFYYGLSNEFIEFPEYTKSMRHYFCIGLEKKIK
jgi:hypothetical protein